MTFVAILLVLFIDRALWDGTSHRQHAWYHRYLDRFNNSGWLDDKPWGALALVLPPLLLLGWLQVSVLPALGELFEFALAAGALLLSIGPRDLGRDTDAYLDARTAGDHLSTMELAEQIATETQPGDDPDRMVIQGIFSGACHRLIGPIFWFVLFGATGAAAYRLSRLLSQRLLSGPDPLSPLARSASTLSYVLAWAPTRITAAGYAVAGNFDSTAAAWKTCSRMDDGAECPNDDALLVATGEAALEQGNERSVISAIEDALALVWRNLTLWVVFIGAVTLISAL